MRAVTINFVETPISRFFNPLRFWLTKIAVNHTTLSQNPEKKLACVLKITAYQLPLEEKTFVTFVNFISHGENYCEKLISFVLLKNYLVFNDSF